VPLLGGSAGDDLKFDNAFVIASGKAYQNAGVIILAQSKIPFLAIKHQHYIPGDIDVVITKANVVERVVILNHLSNNNCNPISSALRKKPTNWKKQKTGLN